MFDAYCRFEAWLKTQHGASIKALRSDRGGEYLSNTFSKHLSSHGTVRKLAIHDTPQQNSVAKRLNCVLLEHTRALLHASGLPKGLWGEAIAHSVWRKNHTSTKALHGRTPLEELTSKKPNLHRLCEWGTKVWVHHANQSKLEGRAAEGRWTGYESDSKALQIYWPTTKMVSIEQNIKFDDDYSLDTAPIEGE